MPRTNVKTGVDGTPRRHYPLRMTTKRVLMTGKITKRNGRIVEESVRADWLTSLTFGCIGREKYPTER